MTREWEHGEVITNVSMPISSTNHHLHDVQSVVRINVGLAGINVTFASHPFRPNEAGSFYFNEEFDWAWAQGREGFGVYG